MAWQQVRKNAGAAGIDNMTVEAFERREDELLRLIHEKLKAGTYRFKPARRVLIPKEVISQWLGAQAGFKGILLGCVAGGLVPGSPYSVFPIIASFYEAGAGIGTIVGFITAWSLWSVSRLPLEVGIIGPRVTLVRYLSTLIFPPLAGVIARIFSAKIS